MWTQAVQLKESIGCEIGSNEVIITELVYENKLRERPPEDIAALFSCMVLRQRNGGEPQLMYSPKKGVGGIREMAARGVVQVKQGPCLSWTMSTVFKSGFLRWVFGNFVYHDPDNVLHQVVYDW